MRGPIDYIIVNFKEPRFEGRILEELQRATGAGTIAVLAMTVVTKHADGSVEELSVDESGLVYESLTPTDTPLITSEDVDEVGSLLEPETAAGLLIIEHLWAKGLKEAILESGGSLVAEGRIHPEAAQELEQSEEE